jgi:hypothetical protein
MTYLSLVADDGIKSTAIVDDAIWSGFRGSIERAAMAAGYLVRCDNVVDGLYPNKACRTMADVAAWIADTAQWV